MWYKYPLDICNRLTVTYMCRAWSSKRLGLRETALRWKARSDWKSTAC